MDEHVSAARGRFVHLICLAGLMSCIAAILPPPASAQPVITVSPPTPIFPDPESGSQSSPSLITDGRGTWLARWRIKEAERVWSYWDARSTDNGKTWSDARRLDVINAAQHYRDRAQTLLAVWSSTDDLGGTIGDDRDILFARSDDFGLTWSEPAPLNANASNDSDDDSLWDVSTDRLGSWIAVWVIGTTERVILVAHSDDDGLTWSEPTPLGTGQWPPRVVADGGGNWLAAWSTAHTGYGGDQDVFFARSTDNGATWTEPAPLNSDAAIDARGIDDNLVLLETKGDTWLAVWIHHEPLAHFIGYFSIEIARSTDQGRTWTDFASMRASNDDLHAPIKRPFLDTDGRGTWLLAWSSSDQWDEGPQIRRSEYAIATSTDDGATWSEPTIMHQVHQAAGNLSSTTARQLVTDRGGNWIVPWLSFDESAGPDDHDAELFLHVSTDNGKTWSLTVPPKGFGEMVTDQTGHWLVLGSIDGRVVASRFALPDCNGNYEPDDLDLADGTSRDCNGNGLPDECDIAAGVSEDCNANGIPDECELLDRSSRDANNNAILDECEPDCNANGTPDDLDIANGLSEDCNTNGVPDECEPDCNENGIPDECDLTDGGSQDLNDNGIPDECEPDCNENGIPDDIDIASGASQDANANAIPDECEPAPPAGGIDPCAPLALAVIVLLLAGLTRRSVRSKRDGEGVTPSRPTSKSP